MLSHKKSVRNLGVAEAFSYELTIRGEKVILTANINGEISIDNFSKLKPETQAFLEKLKQLAVETMKDAKSIPVALRALQKKIEPKVLHAQAKHLIATPSGFDNYWITVNRSLPRGFAEFASATHIGMRTFASLLLITALSSEFWGLGASFGIAALALLVHVMRNPINKKILRGNVERGRALQNYVSTTSLAIASFTNFLAVGQILLKHALELAHQERNEQAKTIGVSVALSLGGLMALFTLLTPSIKAVGPRLLAMLNDETAVLKPGSERLQALYAEAEVGGSLVSFGKAKAAAPAATHLVPAPDLLAVAARLGGAWVVSQQIALAVKVDERIWSSMLVPLAAISLVFASLGRGLEIKVGQRVLLASRPLAQILPSASVALKYFSEFASVLYLLALTPMVASFFVFQRVLRAFDLGISTGAPFGSVDAVALIVAVLLSGSSLLLNLVGRGLGFDAHANVGRSEVQSYLRHVIETAHMRTLERNLKPWVLALIAAAEQAPAPAESFSVGNPLLVKREPSRVAASESAEASAGGGVGLRSVARPSLAHTGVSFANVVRSEGATVSAFAPSRVRGGVGAGRRVAAPAAPAVTVLVAKSEAGSAAPETKVVIPPAKIIKEFFDELAATRHVRQSFIGGVINQDQALLLFQQMMDLRVFLPELKAGMFREDASLRLIAEYNELKLLQASLSKAIKNLLPKHAELTKGLVLLYLTFGALTLLLQSLDVLINGSAHAAHGFNPAARMETDDAKIALFVSAAKDILKDDFARDALNGFDNIAEVKRILIGRRVAGSSTESCLDAIVSQAEQLRDKAVPPMVVSLPTVILYVVAAGGIGAFMGVSAPSSFNPAEQRTVGETELNNIFAVPDPTPSVTSTVSPTASGSLSATASASGAPSSGATPDATVSPSQTTSPSSSVSASVSGSATSTASGSHSATSAASYSGSATSTLSASGSASSAASLSGTATGSPSLGASASATLTSSASAAASLSGTTTGSGTASSSFSGTGSASVAASTSNSATSSASQTASGSPSVSAPASNSNTFTATSSVSVSGSMTPSASKSLSGSASVSLSSSPSPSKSGTSTATVTASVTPSTSGTSTATQTGTTTATSTASVSGSRTATASSSPSGTRTSSPSLSGSSTASATRTKTSTISPSASGSPAVLSTPTPYANPSIGASCGGITFTGTSIICATPCAGLPQVWQYSGVTSGTKIGMRPQSGAVGYVCRPPGASDVICEPADDFDTLQVSNSAKLTAGTTLKLNITASGCSIAASFSVTASRRLDALQEYPYPSATSLPGNLSGLITDGIEPDVSSAMSGPAVAGVSAAAVTLGLLVVGCCGRRMRRARSKARAEVPAQDGTATTGVFGWVYSTAASAAGTLAKVVGMG